MEKVFFRYAELRSFLAIIARLRRLLPLSDHCEIRVVPCWLWLDFKLLKLKFLSGINAIPILNKTNLTIEFFILYEPKVQLGLLQFRLLFMTFGPFCATQYRKYQLIQMPHDLRHFKSAWNGPFWLVSSRYLINILKLHEAAGSLLMRSIKVKFVPFLLRYPKWQ